MNEIRAEIEIDASADRVWRVLTDFVAYSEWNSVIPQISGKAEAGARLMVHVQPRGGLGVTFRPTVLRSELGRELRWQAKLLLSGLFSGQHSFIIEPFGRNQVRFVQREVFSGLLVLPFMFLMKSSVRQVFEDMNKALKARAEKAVAAVREV